MQEGRGKKVKRKREKERERERGREKREKERRSVPECYHSGTPQKAKREEGKGRGRKGVKAPTGSNNLEQAWVAATTYGLPEGCQALTAAVT